MASACFIQPPLCYVGLTEEQAKEQLKGDIDVYVSKFKPLKNTLTARDEKTLMKMIVQPQTDEVSPLARAFYKAPCLFDSCFSGGCGHFNAGVFLVQLSLSKTSCPYIIT